MRFGKVILSTFLLLSTTTGVYAFDNDLNNDGIVDTIYKDSYSGTGSNYKVAAGPSKGERVGVSVSYGVSPYWNQQDNGIEYVRVFTDTLGVQREFNAVPGTVYPESIYTGFKVDDNSDYATITSISPTTSGTFFWDLAKSANELLGLEQANKLIDFSLFLESNAGLYDDKDADGTYGVTSYVRAAYTSYNNWQVITDGKTDLPSTTSSSSAYKDSSHGFVASYKYRDELWTKGSAHTVEDRATIKYVMVLSSSNLSYGWTAGHDQLDFSHKSYGN